ncbi:uncharacterized protein BX664DRAFT_335617 [Halteromyces radiatus]|uniref:uncharacterized protein n=1 Tax=Halteromyces radiatus TaxID=101107 RepID=UPI00222034A2|nr:uncharacterized protein BX664DRAFT_335617 [Halteromyces radiatus]KAI8086356.1 hypothetical protein BX664DRAFT_335617 [Halteromyces radiatus]
MESSESLDLTTFFDEVTTLKTLPLTLVEWQREYNERLGLSVNTSGDDNAANLPLHPVTLENELKTYMDFIDKIKTSYLLLEAKSRFLSSILQDPPKQLEPNEVQRLVDSNIILLEEFTGLQNHSQKLKRDIAKLNFTNEKGRQLLNNRIEEVTKIMDDIHEQKAELTRLQAVNNRHATTRTPEEARAILDQQTKEMAEINKTMDIKRDAVAELEWRIDDEMQEINMLESKLRQVEAQAKEAVEKSEQRDLPAEEQGLWYIQMTTLCNSMFGISKANFDINLIQVDYSTNDQLSIELDPINEVITEISLNNEDIDITDLKKMGNGRHIKDVGSTIVLETLARVKQI